MNYFGNVGRENKVETIEVNQCSKVPTHKRIQEIRFIIECIFDTDIYYLGTFDTKFIACRCNKFQSVTGLFYNPQTTKSGHSLADGER